MLDITLLNNQNDVQKLVMDSDLKYHFNIFPQLKWRIANDNYRRFDIALFNKDILYAIIEVRRCIDSQLDITTQQISQILQLTNCRFGIITDSKKFLLIDFANPTLGYIEMGFNQIVKCLINPNQIQETNNENANIKKALKLYFKDEDIIASIFNDIEYDKNQGFFSFVNLEKERSFFMNVIGKVNDYETIYRYTTLDTLFSILNKGTYMMNGIVGMNDKSEIDYFDKECKIDKSGSSLKELNDTYLSSCCSLKNDLTMWRLYGDNGKGVCLEFKMSPMENGFNDFILAPVNYAENTNHTALKMLKEMSDAKMRFKELYKWKHFFKPHNFSTEKEIRLMFIDNGRYDNGVVNRDWVKTWSHSIINPIVDFQLNASAFPLQLKKIILGSKMPELDTNLSQIDYLVSLKGYSIEVEKSKINNYR